MALRAYVQLDHLAATFNGPTGLCESDPPSGEAIFNGPTGLCENDLPGEGVQF
jgi:hypothetical protein